LTTLDRIEVTFARMTYRHAWIPFFFLVACGNAEEEQKRLDEVQHKADQRFEKAGQEAKQKLDEAQKRADDLSKELNETKAKLEAAVKAQADTEDEAKQAEAALAKAREGFKAAGKVELAAINADINELSPKLSKAAPKAKASATKTLQKVGAQQKAIASDLSEFDTATLDTLGTVRAKLQKDLAALRATARTAKSQLP
jgi:colicin import membrane protein